MDATKQAVKTQQREQKAPQREASTFSAEFESDLFGGNARAPLGESASTQIAMLKRLPPTQQRRMLQRIGRQQGNQHVSRLVSQFHSKAPTPFAPKIQTKLTVNEPDDAYEQEADAVADQVMRMKSAPPIAEPPPDDALNLQRETADPMAGAAVSSNVESRVKGLQGRGEPLPDQTRTFMEDRIGADFSDVRIHRDASSAELSQDLNARAFTVGNNIAFNSGEYNPDSSNGKHLLAHELTHTVQQGAAGQLKREPLIQRDTEAPVEETDEPSPEEKAAAQAKAAAALAAAGGVKSESIGATAVSQSQATAEQSAAAAPKALSDASRAEGAIKETGKQALEQRSAEKAAAQGAAGEALKAGAKDKANAAQQAAQAAPKPQAVSGTVEQAGPPPAPTGDNLEGATAAAQAAMTGAYDKAANAPDQAPRSVTQDAGFAAAKKAAVATGEEQRTHEPADGEATKAQAAAVSPEKELKGQAQSAQVGEMEQAETPSFDGAAFKAKLMEKISALAPQSADEADNLKESGKVDALKGDIQNEASQEKEKSETPLEEKTTAQPDMAKAKPKDVTPLKSAEAGQPPAAIGADKATPKQKGKGEVETPVAEGNAAMDQQMADADITEDQLSNANEPEFASALDAKKEAKQQTEASTQTFRQGEQGQIASAEAEAVASAQSATQTMFTTRTGALTDVSSEQEQTKTEDEASREKVATDIEGIYQKTKTKVDTILNGLDGKVTQLFDEGAKKAADAFENYVDKRMEAYKEERYGGWLGWAKWAADKLTEMPSEVNVFYTEGRKLYIDKMDAVINNVVALIGKTLAEAKAEVANGKREIQQYVDQLPENLKDVGNQATQDIDAKFKALEQDIDAKQNELIDTLAQKYNENLQAIDARIEELKAANKGLIGQAIDKLGGVIKTIIELKNMLLEVLSRAADAIKSIIADPIGFLSNLITAVKQGLQNFLSNIGDHLKKGLMGWLTGTMAGAGITMPEKFDLQGIFSLVMQVAGVSFEQIIGKFSSKLGVDINGFMGPVMQVIDIYQEGGLAGLAQFGLGKLIGEENVAALMEVVEMVKMVLSGDFGALWERIKEHLSNLKEMVMGKIMEFITNEVVKQGIIWVMSLFNPAGAFIKACKMIYDVVMFFVNNGKKIMTLVNSIIDSVAAIASGDVGAASAAIEQALANAIPAAIGFLSSLLGLGNIPAKIQEIIQSVRGFIDSAIDKLLNLPPIQMVVGFIKKLITKMKDLAARGIDKVKDMAGLKKPETKSESEQKHAEMGKEAATELSVPMGEDVTYADLRAKKMEKAKELEAKYNAQLENPVKMSITFKSPEEDMKDEDMDFHIHIGPNDFDLAGAVEGGGGIAPTVGTYGELKNKSGANNQEAHHVPPKGLLGWIVGQATKAEDKLSDEQAAKPENKWLVDIASIDSSVYSPGKPLAAISVHKTTHIKKDASDPGSDLWRIHYGKSTAAEVFKRLSDKGLTLIYKKKFSELNEEDRVRFAALATEAGESVSVDEEADSAESPTILSTQFFKTELNAALDGLQKTHAEQSTHFKEDLGKVAGGAAKQARESVHVTLENSKLDGTPQERQSALNELDGKSKDTWEAQPGIKQLGMF